MEKLYTLKENLITELEDYADKPLTVQSAMEIKVLASAADHICNVLKGAMEEPKPSESIGMYPRYWGDNQSRASEASNIYGRNQSRGANGRYMDGQSGGIYSTYGHDEDPMTALRRMADNARDPNERRVYEDAMNRLRR